MPKSATSDMACFSIPYHTNQNPELGKPQSAQDRRCSLQLEAFAHRHDLSLVINNDPTHHDGKILDHLLVSSHLMGLLHPPSVLPTPQWTLDGRYLSDHMPLIIPTEIPIPSGLLNKQGPHMTNHKKGAKTPNWNDRLQEARMEHIQAYQDAYSRATPSELPTIQQIEAWPPDQATSKIELLSTQILDPILVAAQEALPPWNLTPPLHTSADLAFNGQSKRPCHRRITQTTEGAEKRPSSTTHTGSDRCQEHKV
eukprot:Lithocolla_globosa_v1_NODE_1647_length_2423_cov_5.791385.p2 type:complete len:254 gc:universal NODE_1647_length_2423_cov_5.791385:878-1639(+)